MRNIHTVYTEGHGTNESKYTALAGLVTPAQLLYLIWNEDRMVLFCDHTLAAGTAQPIPYPDEIAAITSHGWPLFLYHPWTLYYCQEGVTARITLFTSRGCLQTTVGGFHRIEKLLKGRTITLGRKMR